MWVFDNHLGAARINCEFNYNTDFLVLLVSFVRGFRSPICPPLCIWQTSFVGSVESTVSRRRVGLREAQVRPKALWETAFFAP